MEIKPAAAAAIRFAVVGLLQHSKRAPELVLSHQQLHDPLLTIRGANRVCQSESEQCKQWTVLMLDCEQGTADSCQKPKTYASRPAVWHQTANLEAYAF